MKYPVARPYTSPVLAPIKLPTPVPAKTPRIKGSVSGRWQGHATNPVTANTGLVDGLEATSIKGEVDKTDAYQDQEEASHSLDRTGECYLVSDHLETGHEDERVLPRLGLSSC